MVMPITNNITLLYFTLGLSSLIFSPISVIKTLPRIKPNISDTLPKRLPIHNRMGYLFTQPESELTECAEQPTEVHRLKEPPPDRNPRRSHQPHVALTEHERDGG